MPLPQCARQGKYNGIKIDLANGKKYLTDDYTLCAHWDLNAKGGNPEQGECESPANPQLCTGCPGRAFIDYYLKGVTDNGTPIPGLVHPHWGGERRKVNGAWQCGVGGSPTVTVNMIYALLREIKSFTKFVDFLPEMSR